MKTEIILRVGALALAVLMGASLAFAKPESASAGSETVRFMGGTFAGGWPNAQTYCFGVAGWHDSGAIAPDVWADSFIGCGTVSGGPDIVYFQTLGNTTSWTTYNVPVWIYNGGTAATPCHHVFARVYKWDGDWYYGGREQYIHTVYTAGGSGAWADMTLGDGYWANSWLEIGETVVPDRTGCGQPDDDHVHQLYFDIDTTYFTISKNTTLVPEDIYDQTSLSKYIHQWTWNNCFC